MSDLPRFRPFDAIPQRDREIREKKLSPEKRAEIPKLWDALSYRVTSDPDGRNMGVFQLKDYSIPVEIRDQVDAIVIDALEHEDLTEVIFSNKLNGSSADYYVESFGTPDIGKNRSSQDLNQNISKQLQNTFDIKDEEKLRAFIKALSITSHPTKVGGVRQHAMNIYFHPEDETKVLISGVMGSGSIDSTGRDALDGSYSAVIKRDSSLYKLLESGQAHVFFLALRNIAAELDSNRRLFLLSMGLGENTSILNLAEKQPYIIDKQYDVTGKKIPLNFAEGNISGDAYRLLRTDRTVRGGLGSSLLRSIGADNKRENSLQSALDFAQRQNLFQVNVSLNEENGNPLSRVESRAEAAVTESPKDPWKPKKWGDKRPDTSTLTSSTQVRAEPAVTESPKAPWKPKQWGDKRPKD